MRPPLENIEILGKCVSIYIREIDGAFGEFDSTKNSIYIDPHQTEREMNRTLFHEMIHAAFFYSGLDEILQQDHMEAICKMLEHGLSDYIRIRP